MECTLPLKGGMMARAVQISHEAEHHLRALEADLAKVKSVCDQLPHTVAASILYSLSGAFARWANERNEQALDELTDATRRPQPNSYTQPPRPN